MLKFLRLVTILAVLVIPLEAQRVIPRFSAYKATSLSGAAETITIQQPSSGGKRTTFIGADVYCSVACVVTLKQNGTAASATTLTPVALTRGGVAVNTAWSGSNVGAGTTIRTFNIAAGGTASVDLSSIYTDGDGTTRNFSIGTDSITGDVKIYIVWEEDE